MYFQRITCLKIQNIVNKMFRNLNEKNKVVSKKNLQTAGNLFSTCHLLASSLPVSMYVHARHGRYLTLCPRSANACARLCACRLSDCGTRNVNAACAVAVIQLLSQPFQYSNSNIRISFSNFFCIPYISQMQAQFPAAALCLARWRGGSAQSQLQAIHAAAAAAASSKASYGVRTASG